MTRELTWIRVRPEAGGMRPARMPTLVGSSFVVEAMGGALARLMQSASPGLR
jgi:hypothetical protein